MASIYYFSRWALLIIAISYGLSGIIARIYSMVRHKKGGEEAPVSNSLGEHT